MRRAKASLNPGEALEKQVCTAFRALPGAAVSEHVLISGKEVDVYCSVADPVLGTIRIAVECKDYTRPLIRRDVAEILSDYRPLLEQNKIDRVMIITRHGIVAQAKDALDGKRFAHMTYDELLNSLLGPGCLVENMRHQFSIDLLSEYYVPVQCYNVDISKVSRHFARVYNPFVELARQTRFPDIGSLVAEWTKLHSEDVQLCQLANSYTEDELQEVLWLRQRGDVTDLEQLVIPWIEDETISQGLALLGSYGLGKSSFARRLACCWAEKYLRRETDRIPLLIELRQFGSHQDIRGLISHELVNRHSVRNGSFETFQLLNRCGRFLIILDGFDEMKQGMTHDSLVFNFSELNKLNVGKSKVILCGRPTVFSSESEQMSLLASADTLSDNSSQYVQIELAPFDQKATVECLRRYAATRPAVDAHILVPKIANVEAALRHSEELRSLLSRPVHIPMLVTILPSWKGRVSDLTRVSMYRTFINSIIEREIHRQRKEFHEYYDVSSRKRFASELAVLMLSSGESRSIRYSDIPDQLIMPYKRQGLSIEATKRDLVRACFLERKPPDILFFPHKSFAEYLAAERIAEELNSPSPRSDSLGVPISDEVFSFVIEIAQASSWRVIAKLPLQNAGILRAVLRAISRGIVGEPPVKITWLADTVNNSEAFRAWLDAVNDVPPMLAYAFLRHIVDRGHCSPVAMELVRRLAYHPDDLVAVNAFRAAGMRMTDEYREFLGEERLEKWLRLGWI
jgi:hypothetical protein